MPASAPLWPADRRPTDLAGAAAGVAALVPGAGDAPPPKNRGRPGSRLPDRSSASSILTTQSFPAGAELSPGPISPSQVSSYWPLGRNFSCQPALPPSVPQGRRAVRNRNRSPRWPGRRSRRRGGRAVFRLGSCAFAWLQPARREHALSPGQKVLPHGTVELVRPVVAVVVLAVADLSEIWAPRLKSAMISRRLVAWKKQPGFDDDPGSQRAWRPPRSAIWFNALMSSSSPSRSRHDVSSPCVLRSPPPDPARRPAADVSPCCQRGNPACRPR